jgi:ketosteroid isomerase-like protein
MHRWYASSDLLLMTSLFEGVPFVIYEALAMGLPVVAPALPGNVELMDADSGVLIAPRDDARAYADAIERLLGDPAARAAMGERSRARIRERFSVRRMAERHEALYAELLERRPPRPPRPPAAAAREPLRLERTPPPERSVAVIVPCFRHGLYLPECLDSIRAQTLPAAQVIVVDDGSDDPETRSALEALDPDVEIHDFDIPDAGGVFHGHEGYREWVRRWTEGWESTRMEDAEYRSAGPDCVIALFRMVAKGAHSGMELERADAIVYRIRGGKIVRIEYYNDQAEAIRRAT